MRLVDGEHGSVRWGGVIGLMYEQFSTLELFDIEGVTIGCLT